MREPNVGAEIGNDPPETTSPNRDAVITIELVNDVVERDTSALIVRWAVAEVPLSIAEPMTCVALSE